MLDGKKLREHRNNPKVDAAVSAAIAHQLGENQEENLGKIRALIPDLKKLGVWDGSDSEVAATNLAIMLAGLEGKRAF